MCRFIIVTGNEFGTTFFTMDDIFKMLEGMDRGLKYNYQGTVAKEGEKTLTRDQLEQLMSRINKQGMPRHTHNMIQRNNKLETTT